MNDKKIDLPVKTSVAIIRAMTHGDTENLYLLLEQYLAVNNLQLPKPLLGSVSKADKGNFSNLNS